MNPRRMLSFARRVLTGDRLALFRLSTVCRGIDLKCAPPEEHGLDERSSYWYVNSGGPYLDAALKRLCIGPTDAVLDVGSGKGGAMITLAKYPFCRIDGIELSPELAEIARRNLARLGLHHCSVFCADAKTFTSLDPYTFLYMFNPFPGTVMRPFLANARSSLDRRPRKFQILYTHPTEHQVVIDAGFREVARMQCGPGPTWLFQHYLA